jgi:methyl-accepting chemotaxis protein
VNQNLLEDYLNLDEISLNNEKEGSDRSVEIYIVDENGNVIMTNMQDADNKTLPLFDVVQTDINEHIKDGYDITGVFTTDIGVDKQSMISYSELDQGWYYIKVQPVSLVRSTILTLQKVSILIVILAAAFAIIAGILIANSITATINNFKSILKQFEQGNLFQYSW